MKYIPIIIVLLTTSAIAQQAPPPPQQESPEQLTVHRELVGRIFEEMNKAIGCQVNLDAAKAELAKKVPDDKKPK